MCAPEAGLPMAPARTASHPSAKDDGFATRRERADEHESCAASVSAGCWASGSAEDEVTPRFAPETRKTVLGMGRTEVRAADTTHPSYM
jgi:hypothetical protein